MQARNIAADQSPGGEGSEGPSSTPCFGREATGHQAAPHGAGSAGPAAGPAGAGQQEQESSEEERSENEQEGPEPHPDPDDQRGNCTGTAVRDLALIGEIEPTCSC